MFGKLNAYVGLIILCKSYNYVVYTFVILLLKLLYVNKVIMGFG